MQNTLLTFVLGSALASTSLAQDGGVSVEERAFRDAIAAAENRNYEQLGSIVEQTPRVLDHRTADGNDLFHEFLYVFHSDGINPIGHGIDLRAIETLLDKGAKPRASNGLIGTLLSEVNIFYGQIEAFPINSGQCTENREEFFPVIDRLIEADAEFGTMGVKIADISPSEAFFYQYQLCFAPYLCGADYERPSEVVKDRVSSSTTQVEIELLVELAAEGSHDLNCLIALNNW